MKKAVFFDRDGVLIRDIHLLKSINQVIIEKINFKAISILNKYNFVRIVITNQTVIARGLLTEEEVNEINDFINNKYLEETGSGFIKYYVCPHHPNANVIKYKKSCKCRKPKPGLILAAAEEFSLDLNSSWMIGDRISDIIAGDKAGCKTILIQTGCHDEKPIISDSFDFTIKADFIVKNLLDAVKIIISGENN